MERERVHFGNGVGREGGSIRGGVVLYWATPDLSFIEKYGRYLAPED